MRGLFFRKLKIQFAAASAVVITLWSAIFVNEVWIKRIVEVKIEEFTGKRFIVKVGAIDSGVLADIVLRDVSFISRSGESTRQVFRLDRIEIPFRLWQAILERVAPSRFKRPPIERVSVYFSDNNPFVQGFVQLYRYPGKVEIMGKLSPELFGDKDKRALKGTILKKENGSYSSSVMWGGKFDISGLLDPAKKDFVFSIIPLEEKKREIKIEGSYNQEEGIKVYSRLYRWIFAGAEVIGDLSINYKDEGVPSFSFSAENIIVDKKPVWDISLSGKFEPKRKRIILEDLKWGEGVNLKGVMRTEPPFQGDFVFAMKDVRMEEIARMFGSFDNAFRGPVSAEVEFSGPIDRARIKGRLFVGEGVMGTVEYKSMFATLGGALPVVKISDARIMKEGGSVIVEGEIDVSKFKENMAFDNLKYWSDDRVAVWDYWQISKEDSTNMVTASKDNLSVSTSMEKNSNEPVKLNENDKVNVGVNYKLDTANSIKVDVDEDDDFLGVEHKVKF
jgi:hypothetical protein